jgi:GT2 family glycosyltransferase
MARQQVSVVIVNYNGIHLLEDCLQGLMAQTRAPNDVVLVDNGSVDDSVEYVRGRFRWVRVVETGANLGFAGGNNLGIDESTGDVVVLLNNDTLPGPGFIECLVRPLEDDESISAIAGVLLFSESPEIVASSGIEVFADGLALDESVGRAWRELPEETEVFGPSGGAAAYRRETLDDVGLFANEFFLYLEDADLAWRMRLRRHRTVARRDAWVLHVYSASSAPGSALKDYYLARNRAWTLIRCWPGAIWRRYWWPVLKYEFGAIGYALMKRRWRSIFGRWHGWTRLFRLRNSRLRVQASATTSDSDLLYWMRPVPSVRRLLDLRRTIENTTKHTFNRRGE